MSVFAWITLLTCLAAMGAACFPGRERLARALSRATVVLFLMLLARMVGRGAFDDLAAVGAGAWLRAGLSVGLPVAVAVVLVHALRRPDDE